jgi:ABC-type iron transport system FetAB ATPase subunit
LTLWNLEKRSSNIVIFDEIESVLDHGNRIAVLQKLYPYLKARNIAVIWIMHMCQCDFYGCMLILVACEDCTGADIQQSQ